MKNISNKERQKLFDEKKAEDHRLFPSESKHYNVPVDESVDLR